MILKENTRNVNYRKRGTYFCDESHSRQKSPSWKGSKWYRFMAPAGTRIPEKPPSFSNRLDGPCGTQFPGWVNGNHPKQPGQLVKRRVCFAYYYPPASLSNNCYWSNYVKFQMVFEQMSPLIR